MEPLSGETCDESLDPTTEQEFNEDFNFDSFADPADEDMF